MENEMLGLRVIVSNAVERGTLHVCASPPEREDYASDETYEAAYKDWWQRMNCWTVTNIGG